MFLELRQDSSIGKSFCVPFASSKPGVLVQSPWLLLPCSFAHRVMGASPGALPSDGQRGDDGLHGGAAGQGLPWVLVHLFMF